MAKTGTSSSETTGEKMAPPSITLLPDKRSPTNSHTSPARTGKTTPSNTEKKPHINGHASPLHLAANINNNHAVVEGYMKTDDRMRLAKERREERERSLVAREQLIREKERRARLQYERTVEERWRRLDEQRQKEEFRRAAVEEKRRQQLEEERERLEALMKRSLERSLQLEQRTKRWSRGCPAGDSENAPLPFSAASAFSHGIASPLPAVSESAPCSPHRSPYCSSLNPADHNRAGLQGGSQSTPNTPKKERLRRDRRTASPCCGSPVRRSESPGSVTKQLASPTTSKLASKMRAPFPSNAHQYYYSPTRHRPNLSSDERKADNKKVEKHSEQSKDETAVKKNADINSTNPSSQDEKNAVNAEITKSRSSKGETFDKHLKGDTSEKNQSPDRKDHMSPKVDSLEKKTQSNAEDGDKKKESALCTSTGKVAAGSTNAEEATRLMAERRRQARAQKELEEKKREQEEEERLREEQLRKQLAQEQRQQEAKAQQVKEKVKNKEDPHRLKQEEENRKEEQEKKLQAQMDKEREKAKVQAQEDAERQRQDRELQAQQEEEERQLRKKRIEEIMKRTRKGEADLKEEQVETKPVSPPGEVKTVQTNAQVNEQAIKKAEFQVKEQATVQVSTKECGLVKKEAAAAQMDSQKSLQVKNNAHQVTPTHSVPDKRPDTKQTSEEHGSQPNREGKACALKQQGREVDVNVNKQHRANVKDQINKGQSEPTEDAKVKQREGGMRNGAVKGEGSASMSKRLTAEVSKQQSLHVSTAEGKTKGGSQMVVIRASVTPMSVGHLSPPIIKLEPLDVKGTGSCDEVQSMEVSPASKEELISIPEFSPVNEIQHSSMSNTRALEDLMDLTGSVTYPKLSSEGNMGDCNKNLIEGVVSPMSDSKLTGMSPPSSNKLSIQ
ncbi:MAP7 domain-containing protein 2a isoform X2 [Siniperca chuatsi]|uniref:MAP7 domain-containing protein 2a isoform X2 n=1 Tax=Siniperca chuatsi TaxID=119488 RepID=UPI001CE086D0|nr:MAP7 domain-containing protein 2a isoform X2 [Siniperca chuatsi]